MTCKMQGCAEKNMSEDLGFMLVKLPTIFNEKYRHQGEA